MHTYQLTCSRACISVRGVSWTQAQAFPCCGHLHTHLCRSTRGWACRGTRGERNAGREERLLGRLCTSWGSATTLRYTNQSICRHILQAVISHRSAVAMSMREVCAPVKSTGSSDMPSFARVLGKSIGFGNAAARRRSLLNALRPRHHVQRAHLPAHSPRKAATS